MGGWVYALAAVGSGLGDNWWAVMLSGVVGSVIGGAVTAAALIATIRHERHIAEVEAAHQVRLANEAAFDTALDKVTEELTTLLQISTTTGLGGPSHLILIRAINLTRILRVRAERVDASEFGYIMEALTHRLRDAWVEDRKHPSGTDRMERATKILVAMTVEITAFFDYPRIRLPGHKFDLNAEIERIVSR